MLWLVVGLSLLVYERESMGSGFLSQSKQIRVILIMKSGGWATTRASFYCIQKTGTKKVDKNFVHLGIS